MNGLSNILNGVDGTEAIILGLGDAGRHSATLPDILDDSAVHPSLVYGSFTGMASTWDANLLYALLHTKLYAGDLTEAQGRIALKVLQLQGERQAYTTRPMNVAMTEKQQRAWDSVEPIINKMRKVHQGDPTIRMLCNKCRTYGCTNALTDGDATLCSMCAAQCKARKLEKVQKKQLEREARKLEKQAIAKDINEYNVVCKKGHGDHERFPGNKLYCHLINVNKEAYNELAFSERSNSENY